MGLFTGQELGGSSNPCLFWKSISEVQKTTKSLLSIIGGYPKQRNKANQIFEKRNRVLVLVKSQNREMETGMRVR